MEINFKTDMAKCYSINGEDFNEDSLDDLIENYGLKIGDKIFIGDIVIPFPSQFFNIDDFFECLVNRAINTHYEYAENFMQELGDDKAMELESLISNWLDKNVSVDFCGVKNIVYHILTEDDFTQSAYQLSSKIP